MMYSRPLLLLKILFSGIVLLPYLVVGQEVNERENGQVNVSSGTPVASMLAANASVDDTKGAVVEGEKPKTAQAKSTKKNSASAAKTKKNATKSAAKKSSTNDADDKDSGENKEDYFAIVDGRTVSLDEFQYDYQRGVKQTFYHGKVAENELESYRKKKVNQLVLDTLLAEEARRRGLKVPENVLKSRLDKLDKKNAKVKNWEKNRKTILGIVRKSYTREELVRQLKDEVVNVKKPGTNKVEEYYTQNAEKFTAPEQWRVSLILLLVDPSSPGTVWDETLEKAAELVERIRDGEDFAEFARIHSGDPSAVDGGDMGYMHIGMLAKPAQEVLNVMRIGEISEPVMLLKGVAIFRLDGVQAPRLNKFTKVQDRATDLLVRKQGEENWLALKKKLKSTKKVVMNSELAKYFSTSVDVEPEKQQSAAN